MNPIHKVSPRATIFAAGVESTSTARNSSSVLLTVKSPFVQNYFALPLLFIANLLYAFASLCSSTHLLFFSNLCLCIAKVSLAFPCPSMPFYAFALPRSAWLIHAFAERGFAICSTPLRCLAAHTTTSLAFAPPLPAIQRLCKSYHCRSRSNPIHAMPLLLELQSSKSSMF